MATVGWAVAGLTLAFPTFAQELASSAKFDISGYSVEGSPLLPSEVFARIMSPFIGR